MCNGASTRTSQGGSIAVLRPKQQFDKSDSNNDWKLLFSNDSLNQPCLGTQIELRGLQEQPRIHAPGYWVVIHRDGDLNAPALPPNQLPSNPLTSFPLEQDLLSTTNLPHRLDLGVGDSGIIGRRVSLMTSSLKGPMIVAEGIAGWN
ncbi:hypothetical protein BDV96DRAFT_667320 [Lophiotrema nucula]|uniref:Uncharacterized protein n=1 Tax=Lophiotrema nucula TaxID=690887 RepID=A0A6A5YT69_9PLEO|nr:hypothetical protein BDV96DRAFT_667320 [Lophiotrema nucula]